MQESASGPPKRACTDGSEPVPSAKVSSELREQIVQLYKLQMPEDLYHFWDFCQGLCPDDPRGMFLFYIFFLSTFDLSLFLTKELYVYA